MLYGIQDDTLLVIGWGTTIKIASIKTNQARGVNGSYRQLTASNMNQVDIVASFQTSYFISGVAPFGDTLVVLAYIPGEEDGEKEFSSSVPSRQVFHLLSCCNYFKIDSLYTFLLRQIPEFWQDEYN